MTEQAGQESQLTLPETTEPPVREKSEGEMVIELLQTFQAELKAAKEDNQIMRTEIKVLNDRVNKELYPWLDQTFKDIQGNFGMVTKALEAVAAKTGTQTSGVAAAAAQGSQGSGGIQGLIEGIIKRIVESPSTSSQVPEITQMDRDISMMGRQLIKMTYQKALKDFGKSAGIEVAEHVVVSP